MSVKRKREELESHNQRKFRKVDQLLIAHITDVKHRWLLTKYNELQRQLRDVLQQRYGISSSFEAVEWDNFEDDSWRRYDLVIIRNPW